MKRLRKNSLLLVFPVQTASSTVPSSFVKRKHFSWKSFSSILVVILVLCDITLPVHPAPSSSAWSLPTLNYLFKDTKTRSQSNQYQKKDNGNPGGTHQYKTLPGGSGSDMGNNGNPSQSVSSSSASSSSSSQLDSMNNDGQTTSTGRLISVHDIRLTDKWGWTEQRRKQIKNNIRHSKSKHKQRRYPAPASSSSLSSKLSPLKKKKDNVENLLCPFDEIRGPDGKCRKAPRFSLYRVGRK